MINLQIIYIRLCILDVKHLSVIHGFIYLLLGLLSIPCLQEFLKINSISTVLVLHYGKHAVCLITKHPRLNLT